MIKVGDTLTYERVFTKEEVLQFAEISGDKGRHHMIEDANGRLVVHGLLTGSLPTKLGGDFNLLANKISFNFTRQVFTGDKITCTAIIKEVMHVKEGRMDIYGTFECVNQDEVTVLYGDFGGVIFE